MKQGTACVKLWGPDHERPWPYHEAFDAAHAVNRGCFEWIGKWGIKPGDLCVFGPGKSVYPVPRRVSGRVSIWGWQETELNLVQQRVYDGMWIISNHE